MMSRIFRQSALQKFRQCTGILIHKRYKDSLCRTTTHANLKTEDKPVSVSEFQHIYNRNLKGNYFFCAASHALLINYEYLFKYVQRSL